jgi:homoserine O-acetyltransferase
VSYPDYTSSIIVIGASSRTNPQSRLALHHAREVMALDPGWHGGIYDVNPVTGLCVAVKGLVPWFRAVEWYSEALTTPEKVRDYERFWDRICISSGSDARDFYYQIDGYAEFNVGDTPGFNGDAKAALGAIKAKALLIAFKEDQIFRREETLSDSKAIHDATYVELSSAAGHKAGMGTWDPKADEAMNREITKFLSSFK